eukprot:NODE_779_length_4292_cov_0.220606.p1 type:complete len:342 gc:universal NODE_779_length_4292_cov_0.220606:2984-4009(+)
MHEYELLDEIGSGTFGKVFRASQNNQYFAIKRIKKSNPKRFLKASFHQPNHEMAIKREIAILKKLNHDHCVKMIDALEDDTYWYLVFKEHIPVEIGDFEYHAIFNDVFLALEYIHAHDIIHLDIKPDNLLYDSQTKKIILCDFGLSELLTNSTGPSSIDSSSSSSSWTKSATIAFAAPENIFTSANSVPSNASIELPELQKAKLADMYAFGMTVYYFEYGLLPFQDLDDMARMEALSTLEIPFNPGSNSTIILQGLLQKDIFSRFDTTKCRKEIDKIPDWPFLIPYTDNVQAIPRVTQSDIDTAFKRVHFMATVIKAVTRFKRGSKSNADMNNELDKLQIK